MSRTTFFRVPELEYNLLIWELWFLAGLASTKMDRMRRRIEDDPYFRAHLFRDALLNAASLTQDEINAWVTKTVNPEPVARKTTIALGGFGVALLHWERAGRRCYDLSNDVVETLVAAGEQFLDTPLNRVPWPADTFFVRTTRGLEYAAPDVTRSFMFSMKRCHPQVLHMAGSGGFSVVALPSPTPDAAAFIADEQRLRKFVRLVREQKFGQARAMLKSVLMQSGLLATPLAGSIVENSEGITPRFLLGKQAMFLDERCDYDLMLRIVLGIAAMHAARSEREGRSVASTLPLRIVANPRTERSRDGITIVDDVCVVTMEEVQSFTCPKQIKRRGGVSGWEMPYYSRPAGMRRRPGEPKSVPPSIPVKPYEVHPEKKPPDGALPSGRKTNLVT